MLQIAEERGWATEEGRGLGKEYSTENSTPPTLVSMATTTLERVIMQFPLFRCCKLFNWYHMYCAVCGRQSFQYSDVAEDMIHVFNVMPKKNNQWLNIL